VIHVNAGFASTDCRKKVCGNMPGLCGASDYGLSSAHSSLSLGCSTGMRLTSKDRWQGI
jgi:hypothetical protein